MELWLVGNHIAQSGLKLKSPQLYLSGAKTLVSTTKPACLLLSCDMLLQPEKLHTKMYLSVHKFPPSIFPLCVYVLGGRVSLATNSGRANDDLKLLILQRTSWMLGLQAVCCDYIPAFFIYVTGYRNYFLKLSVRLLKKMNCVSGHREALGAVGLRMLCPDSLISLCRKLRVKTWALMNVRSRKSHLPGRRKLRRSLVLVTVARSHGTLWYSVSGLHTLMSDSLLYTLYCVGFITALILASAILLKWEWIWQIVLLKHMA